MPFSVLSSQLPDIENLPMDANLIKPGWVLHGNPYMMERASSKFSSRRKARHTNTSFAWMRPAVIDRVIDARNRLRSAIHGVNSSVNSSGMMDGRHVSGLGKCIMSLKDGQKAVDSYTHLIKRYAFHGLLLYAILKGHVGANEDVLKEINVELRNFEGPGSYTPPEGPFDDGSMINLVMTDIDSFSKVIDHPFDLSYLSEALRKELFMTDYLDPAVLLHQLKVLVSEYAASGAGNIASVLFREDLHTHRHHSVGLVRQTETIEMYEINDHRQLFIELKDIEAQYAQAVINSREKDGNKGAQIIPDHTAINRAGQDAMSDSVVRSAVGRMTLVNEIVDGYFRCIEGNNEYHEASEVHSG
jgi:hypothetical protein